MNNRTTTRTALSAIVALLVLVLVAGTASAAAGAWSYNGTDSTAQANASSGVKGFDWISIDLTTWNISNATEITWSGSGSDSPALYFANVTEGVYNALGTGANGSHFIGGNATGFNDNRTLNITSGVVIPSLTITFTEVGNPLNNTTTTVMSFTASNLYFIPDAYSTQVGTNKTLYIQATGVQGGDSDPTYHGVALVEIGTGSASAGAYLYNTTHKAKSVRSTLSAGTGSATFNGTAIGSVAVSAVNLTGDLVNATAATVTVTAGNIDHFDVLPDPTSTRAGEPLTKITVKAKDAYNNLITDFAGTVTFTSNSSAPTAIWAGNPAIGEIRLPGPHTFEPSDGGQYDFTGFNDTVTETVKVIATLSGGTANGSGTVTVGSAGEYYLGIALGASGNKTAGAEFNATVTVYDVFYNINYSSTSAVHVNCSAPTAVASVNTATGQPVGSNNTTIAALDSPTLVYVNLTNSTVEDIWGETSFNLTANCTGLLPHPVGGSSGMNNASTENIEVVPNNASKLYTLCNLTTFQANGRAREEKNVTIYLRDVYDNNCTKTTNATGIPVVVDFKLTGVNATNASFSSVATDTPAGPMVLTLPISADNSMGLAIAKVHLWSNKPLSSDLILTINISNAQGLTNESDVTCTVTPWLVDHINIIFSRDPIVANGTDVATITAYLEDDENVTVTTASFKVTFDFNTADPSAKAMGQLNVSNTTLVQAVAGVVTGVSVNATKTNAVAGTDNPTQKLNVTANVTDSPTVPAYTKGGNSSLLNVTPGPAAWLNVISAPTTQTVAGVVTIASTVRDANMNIVLNNTVVGFRTTSGLINMSERTVKGNVAPTYTSPQIASTATITATTDSVSNTTDVVFTPDVTNDDPEVPPIGDPGVLYLSGDTPADGTSTVTVTVYLKDQYNNTNTITNTTVYLSTTRGTFAAATGEFVNGVYQTTLTSATPGSATVTANIGNWRQDTAAMTFTEVAVAGYDAYTKATGKLNLYPVWNFISVPKKLNTSYDTFGELGISFDAASYKYNASAGSWSTLTSDSKLEPLESYWVHVASQDSYTLTYKAAGMAVPPSKQLYAGWNAIGVTSEDATMASTTLQSVTDKWSTVIGWNAVDQTYQTSLTKGVTSGDHSESNTMKPCQGYWVWMTADKELAAISA